VGPELLLMNFPIVSHLQRVTLSPAEFSFATGLSLSTVNRRIATGEIRSTKLGRRVLIPCDQLERICGVKHQDEVA
jgi:excisionase family DNA binding protein